MRSRHMEEHAAEARASLPEPGDTPIQHLRHTVATFDGQPDDELVVMATSGIYPQGRTGLTWGDLRLILDWLERSEEHLTPDHPVF